VESGWLRQKECLREVCERRNTSMSQAVEEAVLQWLDRELNEHQNEP